MCANCSLTSVVAELVAVLRVFFSQSKRFETYLRLCCHLCAEDGTWFILINESWQFISGVDRRRHDRQLVEAKLRARAVPLHPAPHHEAEGAQEVVLGTVTGKVLLRGAEELQAGRGAAVWAVRQLARLRPNHFVIAPGPWPVQLHLHVKPVLESFGSVQNFGPHPRVSFLFLM